MEEGLPAWFQTLSTDRSVVKPLSQGNLLKSQVSERLTRGEPTLLADSLSLVLWV